MDAIRHAISLCAEIEAKQTELRLLLAQICDELAIEDNKTGCQETCIDGPVAEDEDVEETVVCKKAEEPLQDNHDNPAPAAVQKPRGDIRKAFTINDRFRFRRELFAGDDSALTAVIDHLATLDSLSEADSYLSTMPWDSDSEALSEFMTIVSNYFNGYRG